MINSIEIKQRTLRSDSKRNAESRSFYDLIVDGKSLFEQFIDEDSDMVGHFGFYNDVKLNLQVIDEFQLKDRSKLESGQSMLFVCRECGDIGCGAITVKIKEIGDQIIWSNYKWENDDEESYDSDFIDFQVLKFNKVEYLDVLEVIRKKCLQHH